MLQSKWHCCLKCFGWFMHFLFLFSDPLYNSPCWQGKGKMNTYWLIGHKNYSVQNDSLVCHWNPSMARKKKAAAAAAAAAAAENEASVSNVSSSPPCGGTVAMLKVFKPAGVSKQMSSCSSPPPQSRALVRRPPPPSPCLRLTSPGPVWWQRQWRRPQWSSTLARGQKRRTWLSQTACFMCVCSCVS